MKLSPRLLFWVFANVAVFVGIPLVFAFWLQQEVSAQYTSGVRVSTDGDSLSIPVAIVVVLTGAGLLLLNAVVLAFKQIRRLVARRRASSLAETQ